MICGPQVRCIRPHKMMLLLLLSRFSHVRLCAIPLTAAHQAPESLDSPGKNTGVGYHFLLQSMKVKSESEVAQSCPTPSIHEPTFSSFSCRLSCVFVSKELTFFETVLNENWCNRTSFLFKFASAVSFPTLFQALVWPGSNTPSGPHLLGEWDAPRIRQQEWKKTCFEGQLCQWGQLPGTRRLVLPRGPRAQLVSAFFGTGAASQIPSQPQARPALPSSLTHTLISFPRCTGIMRNTASGDS